MLVDIENDNDAKPSLPDAVAYEYHPHSKNRRLNIHYRRWRQIMLLFVVLILALVIVVASVVLTRMDACDDDANVPNMDARTRDLQQVLETVLGNPLAAQLGQIDPRTTTSSSSSPYVQAWQWIVQGDPLQLTIEHDTWLQRYFAAYLYYATTQDGPWTWCNPVSNNTHNAMETILTNTMNASVSTSSSLILPTCHYLNDNTKRIPWLSATSECEWLGVTCDRQGQMIAVDFSTYTLA